LQFAFGLLRAVAVVELDVLEVLPLENERPEFVGGLGRAGRLEHDTFVLWRDDARAKQVALPDGQSLERRTPVQFLRWRRRLTAAGRGAGASS